MLFCLDKKKWENRRKKEEKYVIYIYIYGENAYAICFCQNASQEHKCVFSFLWIFSLNSKNSRVHFCLFVLIPYKCGTCTRNRKVYCYIFCCCLFSIFFFSCNASDNINFHTVYKVVLGTVFVFRFRPKFRAIWIAMCATRAIINLLLQPCVLCHVIDVLRSRTQVLRWIVPFLQTMRFLTPHRNSIV